MDIFIDGACSGNPGPGKAVVYIDKNQCNFISHDVALTRKLERTTNNKAEYYGLILALEWIENAIEDIKNNGAKQINIYTDSKLIEGQINSKEETIVEIELKEYHGDREHTMAGSLILKEYVDFFYQIL